MKQNTGSKVWWSELLPNEFKTRLADCPVVYLPLGLCEPHGQVSAFGLDLIKAEWLCEQAAIKAGGIVAPSMGYHIHETGYHARWLEDTVGEENPHMTSVPPGIFLPLFLYQLRAFVNAGFKAVVVLSGHSGGNQEDLRLAARIFMEHVPIKVWVRSDPELVEGIYTGDHAGKYEISQLMYIRPDLVNLELAQLEEQHGSGGRLALGDDAKESSAALGVRIMNACLTTICKEVAEIKQEFVSEVFEKVSYKTVENIWSKVLKHSSEWTTANPWEGQAEVSPDSQWNGYMNYRVK
jgi:creatinine amidohydrolase